VLVIQSIRKQFGELVAVKDVSLSIAPGEIFGLLGPNGAGKTTTVNMCVGLLRPDSGSIAIGDAGDPTNKNVRRLVGVAPQSLAIYEEMSGRENVIFFGKMQGLRGAELKQRVDWALEFVGLADRQKDKAAEYSGGMKRRLNLAIAVVHKPKLLLLDEPTVGVDPQSRNAIFEHILALRAMETTIIYTTHYMEEAQRLCDRVGIMDRGQLLAIDTVDGLIDAHGGASRVIATQPDGDEVEMQTEDPLAELQRLQDNGGLQTFRVERANLETVFLNLTGRALRDE